jgi:uncharacterized surface protein with fasciclin (FAS1) repeats
MSLDVALIEEKPIEVYERNITHNLNEMAEKAGIYKHLWRPDELELTKAWELVLPLEEGLDRLRKDPDTFKVFSPKNGWGSYDILVEFVESYIAACKEHPGSIIRVSR